MEIDAQLRQSVRGHLRNYMHSLSIIYSGITDAPMLEAFACREALALAKDLNISQVLVSLDCAMVIKDIETGGGGGYGASIKEIRDTSHEFESCNFLHESRTRNFEAVIPLNLHE